MQAVTFWRTVTMDHADLLEQALQVLEAAGAHYCVIGGQAVNAYAEPVVSLDLALALAPSEIERLGVLFGPPIRIERFEHSVNLSAPGSELRIQFQTDPRYQDSRRGLKPARFSVTGCRSRGWRDVLRGKVWPKGTDEPKDWTIEAADLTPNRIGSPGLFGNASDAEILIDNIAVAPNK